MLFRLTLLLSALWLAGNVAYAAIFGFMAIFSATPLFAMSMGASIEVGKLLGISYLYRFRDKISRTLKYVGYFLVIVAIVLSAMGVFGFLTDSNKRITQPITNNQSQIEFVNNRVTVETQRISDAREELKLLDQEVQKLIEFDKVSGPNGSKATRQNQQPQRDKLQTTIETSQQLLFDLQQDKLTLDQDTNDLTAKIGPIKHVAELIWPDENLEDTKGKAIRLYILMVMLVFDPLAIILLIYFNKLSLIKEEDKIVIIEDDDKDDELEDIVTDDEPLNEQELEETSSEETLEDDSTAISELSKKITEYEKDSNQLNDVLSEVSAKLDSLDDNSTVNLPDEFLKTVNSINDKVDGIERQNKVSEAKQKLIDDIRSS